MRVRRVVGLALAGALALGAQPAAASGNGRSIVRIREGLIGWNKINFLCSLLSCQVGGSLDIAAGRGRDQLALPGATAFPDFILPGQCSASRPSSAICPCRSNRRPWGSTQATAGVLDDLCDRTPGAVLRHDGLALLPRAAGGRDRARA